MHVRCPHCHIPIELLDEAELSAISCPTCGSSFSLLEETVSQQQSQTKMVAHFELIEEVGLGAFGSVWKAHDRELDRVVAIKIPRKGQLDADETEQFLREARAAAQLRHPHVVSVHEVGRDNDQVYIVRDYVEGVTLSDYVQHQQLSTREAVELCAKVADALQHAHEQGVIHRDLKTSNIMLDVDCEPYIMDFGLAKREASEITMTMDGRLIGTPAYMSPEQARGEGHEADQSSDVYSLGVILFRLLTGELPFRGNPRMLVLQILQDDPPSPRKLNAGVARDLETLCLKCLEKEPRRRYQSAQELADELRRFLRGEPLHARRISQLARAGRWCRRNPLAATVLAGLAVVVCCIPLAALREASMREQAERGEREARDALTKEATMREQLRRQSYVTNIRASELAWQLGNVGWAQMLLDRHRDEEAEDLRGFEWFHLWHRCRPASAAHTLKNPGSVFGLACSADGQRLAARVGNHRIEVWDSQTGRELQGIEIKDTALSASVAISANGQTLAAGCTDGSVRLWKVSSGKQRSVLGRHEEKVVSVAFSPDAAGKLLATGGAEDLVRVWDTASGEMVQQMDRHKRRVVTIAFSPDGTQLATGSYDKTICIWNPKTGDFLGELKGHRQQVLSVVFSPNGKTLASRSADDTILIWNLEQRKSRIEIPAVTPRGTCVSFSEDGSRLAFAVPENTVKIWDLAAGREVQTLRGHSGWVSGVVFLPKSSATHADQLASASHDGLIQVWSLDAKTRYMRRLPDHPLGAQCLAFSPTGARLVVGCGDERGPGALKIWDLATGTAQTKNAAHPRKVTSVAFSRNGRWLASGGIDRLVRIWDAATLKLHRTLDAAHPGEVNCVAFSGDGSLVASGGNGDAAVRIWDAELGQPITVLKGHTGSVRSLAFSPDGRWLASSAEDGLAKIWPVDGWRPGFTLRDDIVRARQVAFSASGKILAVGGTNHTVRLWDPVTRQPHAVLAGHGGTVGTMSISADGKTLASAGDDHTVRLWNLATGEQLIALDVERFAVRGVAFSPDARTLAACDASQTIQLWFAAADDAR